jgi:N-acetylmuramoyl-L-alanine amidase
LRKYALAALFVFTLGAVPALQAASVVVKNLRLWRAPDHTRLVFDLSAKTQHRVLVLADPDRLVIDLDQAEVAGAFADQNYDGPFLMRIRTGQPTPNVLRIVLDLKKPVNPRTFVLKPNEIYGHRLVVDLYNRKKVVSPVAATAAPPGRPYSIIAIDAGHGGEDPGTIGRKYRSR